MDFIFSSYQKEKRKNMKKFKNTIDKKLWKDNLNKNKKDISVYLTKDEIIIIEIY